MIINLITGKEPTVEEMQAIRARAVEIFRNPYASPEQIEWAIEVYPEGFAELIPPENYHEGRMP